MFIKKLIISSETEIIRDIEFKSGLNLIIDNTPSDGTKLTGNNVGKTTVLKLIDFCLGAEGKVIFTDTENSKQIYNEVKNFLIQEKIIVTLILVEDFDNPVAKQIEIQRNFLNNKKSIRKINGKNILSKDFEYELKKIIMPGNDSKKPTFRQIISHNIRYKNNSINNTLKTLNEFTDDIQYETLYLYLLGCDYNEGEKKQELNIKINQERLFKERLEKDNPKTTYEMLLALLEDEIKELDKKRKSFNINEFLEKDLEQLNIVKYSINKVSSRISQVKIRINLIEESKRELEDSISHIDIEQLSILYKEAKLNMSGIQKTFEDLVVYHNNMVRENIKYICRDLPDYKKILECYNKELLELLEQEKQLTICISKGDSFKELEKVMYELNEKYRKKGELESIINQLDKVEKTIEILNEQIESIDQYLFSSDFEDVLKEQVMKFNKFFANISQELYGEKYALTYRKEINKKGRQYYKFDAFNTNMSSGKKQGEILCFDLAYYLFAIEEKIPCVHFLLNDKKELLHGNQLLRVADYVKNKNIQLIISMLRDKLPEEVIKESHIAIELSQDSKLFKIDSYN